MKTGQGDIVYIKTMEEPQNERCAHYIHDIVFKCGNVIDPVTGKRCRGPDFIPEEKRNFGSVPLTNVKPAGD